MLGPKKLPEAGRQVAKAIAEVRKWSQGFQDEIKNVMEPEEKRREAGTAADRDDVEPVMPHWRAS